MADKTNTMPAAVTALLKEIGEDQIGRASCRERV